MKKKREKIIFKGLEMKMMYFCHELMYLIQNLSASEAFLRHFMKIDGHSKLLLEIAINCFLPKTMKCLKNAGGIFPSFFLLFKKEGCWLFKNMFFLLFYIYFLLF